MFHQVSVVSSISYQKVDVVLGLDAYSDNGIYKKELYELLVNFIQ